MAGLLDFMQSASNSAASNVSAPVDGLAWLLRKAGVPVPSNPLLGSDWMAGKGLTRQVEQSAASLAGETFGLLGPAMTTQFAPQIARGLLQMGENGAMPNVLSKQAGAVKMGRSAAPEWGEDFSAIGGKLNPDGTVTVYHRTTPENASSIRKSGVMRGKEDGLFFSSTPTGEVSNYGDGLVKLNIPASKLSMDDLFDREMHFRMPTKRALEAVNIKDWIQP